MAVRFVLVYQDQRVPLPDGDTVVGRSMSCQVRFNAPTVSRQHLRLHVAGDRITVENLSDTTGTLLNGRKLTAPTGLSAGDQLTLGPREVRIERADPGDARLARAPLPALGLLPDGDDDEITLTEDVSAVPAPLAAPHIEFHTCPRCRSQVPFHRSVCGSCGHRWSADHPSARLGSVTSPNVADDLSPLPGAVMAVYASEAMTLDVTLTELDRARAFVPTELFDAPGTECELTLLPDGQAPLTCRGRVAAAQPELPGRRPAGLEVQLTEMSDGTRLWLELFARQKI